MDIPLLSIQNCKFLSVDELTRELTQRHPEISVRPDDASAQASAQMASSHLGVASILSLEAENLALDLGPALSCGLVLCCSGTIQVRQGRSAPQVLQPQELLIFGCSGMRLSGGHWGAVVALFAPAAFTSLSGGALPAALQKQQGGRLIINNNQEGLTNLGKRSLLALIGYIGLFTEQPLAIPTEFEFDRLLIRHVSWMASLALQQADPPTIQATPRGQAQQVLDAIATEIMQDFRKYQSLDQLATRSGYSKRQLQHLFKLHFFVSPLQFIKRSRLLAASERLRSPLPGDNVQLIAREFGWRHLSSFSKDFKRQFGLSPSLVLRRSKQQLPSPTDSDPLIKTSQQQR